ncbi:MAG TPA: hypothetical protein VGC87_09770 [Pyrinomonadaceae bacterium]|jgi:hypothetical protein
MLARKSVLKHPSGYMIETPLLVPSFSSKGFRVDNKGQSEIKEILDVTDEALHESMLISAYDIYHGYIPPLGKLKCVPQITFLDSGGYETSDQHDFSAVFRHTVPAEPWDAEKLASVYEDIPDHIPAVLVSFDHGSVRMPLKTQIENARRLFKKYPKHLHNILLKPEKKSQRYIQMSSVIGSVHMLKPFDIIGVTEKELSDQNSILSRMQNIAQIRMALDAAHIEAPIHVFGSLDPISSCLYFLAGAEIFDGLTWLRFTYMDGMAVYNQNYGALNVGIDERETMVRGVALMNNVVELRRLQSEMKAFLLDYDFSKFRNHEKLLRESYDSLRTRIGGGS